MKNKKNETVFKRTAYRVAALLAAMSVLFASVTVSAETNVIKNIRVGFFSFDGYHMLDENGNPYGYGYDILQHMRGYADWRYEYIGYDKSWNEMQDMLESGEIDILTSAQKTPERLERFDFSTEPIGTSTAALTMKSGDTRYQPGNCSDWNGIRIGIIKGNSRNQGLAEFAKENGFTYTPVYFASIDDMENALKAGDGIDAILTSNLRAIQDEWVLAQFDQSPFYIMVKKGNSKLLDEVNKSLGAMFNDEPGLRTRLMNKYYSTGKGKKVSFTTAELEYIESMRGKKVTAVISPDRKPYSYFENGVSTGIVGDIAREIISRSGIEIEIMEIKDRNSCNTLMESGGIDIRLDAWYNYPLAENQGYFLTAPYFDVPVSRLYRRDQQSFDSVALLTGATISSAVEKALTENHSSITYYDTLDQIKQAILNGKQNVAFLYGATADLIMRDDITNKLISETVYGNYLSLCVAVSENREPLLFSIMNKTVSSISADDIADIAEPYSANQEKKFSVIGYIYDYPVIVFLVMLTLLVLAVLSILTVFSIRRHKREHAQLEVEIQRAEELSQALMSAERADAAKSQFLSRVSHEMRTPLNAIIGFLNLADTSPPEQEKMYLKNSATAAKQLLAVINDVLDMSSIETGKMKISNAPFNFPQLIQAVTGIFLPQCSQKGIVFETKFLTPVDDWLNGDQLRVNQILMNLISNSVKFTDNGRIELSISELERKNDTAFIRFVISDTGCGMSEDMKKRLFKSFEQESAQTAQKYGGSGLGLSIVKNLVTIMHGAIRVESSGGTGTAFTVDLPFGIPDNTVNTIASESVKAAPEQDGGIAESSALSGKRVLLAEDNEMNRMVAVGLLNKFGVECDIAENGRIAADKFIKGEPGSYDAILMDIQMPELNGFEATGEIRASDHPEAADIPIIALTANAFDDDVAKVLSAGMNGHVAKPIEPATLCAALERVFNHKNS